MTKAAWAGLIAVFLVALAARVGWVAVRHARAPETLAYPDEHAYLLSARSLAAGQGLVDEFGYRATYMPGYPAFLACFVWPGATMLTLRICQAVLASGVAPLTFLLAWQWLGLMGGPTPARGSVRASVLAGLAAAVDPFLVFFSGLLLTEALYVPMLVATWWLVMRLVGSRRRTAVMNAIFAGFCVLACILLRPSSTMLIPIVPVVVLIYRRFDAASVLAGGIVLAVVFLGLFPWAARNARILGEWRWTTTRGGISLYDGLQLQSGGASDLAHTKDDPAVRGMGELAWDAYWRRRAVENVRSDPIQSLVLAGRKCLRTWNIVPNEPEHRKGTAAVISAAWMTVALASAAAGWWKVRTAVRWWVLLLIPVGAFTALHMVFVGSVRYRIPLMPLVFVLAAVGLGGGFALQRRAGADSDMAGATAKERDA